MDFIRECPGCKNEIKYKRHHSLKKALDNNSLCKSCTNTSEDRCKKLSKARKRYLKNLSPIEKEDQVNKMKNSLKEIWSNKSNAEMDEWRKKVSETTNLRCQDEEYLKKLSKSIKKTHWSKSENKDEILSKIVKTRIEKHGKNHFTGRCKEFIIAGIKCDGKYEEKYIKYLIDNNLKLPKNGNTIKTPYGTYTPDFEFDDCYIEIKSPFTFDVLIGKKSYSKNRKSNEKQLNKIKWVNKNLKRVKILIISNEIKEYGAKKLQIL